MTGSATIVRYASIEARLVPFIWRWAEENRDVIAANWDRRRAERPNLFNGPVLLVCGEETVGDMLRIGFFVTEYASLLAFLDLAFPDPSVANGFAMGALQAADGAFVLGVMAPHTANAGQVYFAAGTPDLSDVGPDGAVDLAASVMRELAEETGLTAERCRSADGWIVVRESGHLAFMRPITVDEDADALRARILSHVAAQSQPELSEVRILRRLGNIDERTMPRYLQAFLRWSFGQGTADEVAEGRATQ